MHFSLQKLHVFNNSRRATKRSSKLSPGCCMCRHRLCCSTDSLTWPSMWRLIAVIMLSTSFICSAVRPRLVTMERVSLNQQSVNTYTLVSADFPLNPDRVVYDSHWDIHASKSAPRSTCMSSLGRYVCRNTHSIFGVSTG